MSTANRVSIDAPTLRRTRAIACRLARLLRAGDVLLLQGPLGAGKTAFAQGLGEGLRLETAVSSPTFVLMARHEGPLRLFHADLYRLEDPEEVAVLGLAEQAAEGVLAVEWPERALEVLPSEHLLVIIEPVPEDADARRITLVPRGARAQELLDGLGDV